MCVCVNGTLPAPHSRSKIRVCCVLTATARSRRLRSDKSRCNFLVFFISKYSSACLISSFFSSIMGLISALKSCSLCGSEVNVSSALNLHYCAVREFSLLFRCT